MQEMTKHGMCESHVNADARRSGDGDNEFNGLTHKC